MKQKYTYEKQMKVTRKYTYERFHTADKALKMSIIISLSLY